MGIQKYPTDIDRDGLLNLLKQIQEVIGDERGYKNNISQDKRGRIFVNGALINDVVSVKKRDVQGLGQLINIIFWH